MDDNINSWLNDQFDNLVINNLFDANDLILEPEIEEELNLNNFDFKNTNLMKDDKITSDGKIIGTLLSTNNVMKIEIKLNKSLNLNKFLNSQIFILVPGYRYVSSIRATNLLADKILKYKIIKDDKYFIIPILLFVKPNKFHKPNFQIHIFNDCKPRYNLKISWDTFNKKIKNMLQINNKKYKINDCIDKYKLYIYDYVLGFIIWYESNNDTEFLEPSILKAEINLYKNNIKFNKPINIEKIKFNNKTGYFIPTNRLNFDQIFNYQNNNLIDWNDCFDSNNDSYIEINWSIYHDDSFCIIETVFLLN
jgi:hypothetical protein